MDEVYNFNEPKILYGGQYYIDEDYIYVANTDTGTIHIFDRSGNFLTGYQLPTDAGGVWFGLGDNFCAYSVRKALLVKINGTEIVSQDVVYFESQESFYGSLNQTDKYAPRVKQNKVYIAQKNETKEIVLDIQTSVLPIYVYNALAVIFMLAYVLLTLHWREGRNPSSKKLY